MNCMPAMESSAPISFDEIEQLAANGQFIDAIRRATALNRAAPDPVIEMKMLEWRHQALAGSDMSAVRAEWPPSYPDVFGGASGLPEIAAADLNTQTLAAGILHHGGVLVRGLLSESEASSLAAGIDRAFAAASDQSLDYDEAKSNAWYRRLPLPADHFINASRPWVESSAGVLMSDSPRMMFEFSEVLDKLGLVSIIEAYMGERPVLSLAKTTLRKVPKTLQNTGWHQDGQFLGEAIRSVNCWLALSPCGQDASGLDLIPKRIDHILPTGTGNALLDWAIGDDVIAQASHDAPVVTPIFRPGDALLFDHYLAHRTGIPPQMRHDRYAIESWFFAPSHYPLVQGPLYI